MLTFIPTATSDPFLDSVPPKTSRTLEQPRATLGNVFNRKFVLCFPSKENPCECLSSKWPFLSINLIISFLFLNIHIFSYNAGILCSILVSSFLCIVIEDIFPSLKEWKALKTAWTFSSSVSSHLVAVACGTVSHALSLPGVSYWTILTLTFSPLHIIISSISFQDYMHFYP